MIIANRLTRTLLGLTLPLALALTATPILAQAGDDNSAENRRHCILIGMLGGPLPPRCIDNDEDYSAQLDQLRLGTVAFHSRDVAAAAGWNATISECVESPAGGMGYHVANIDYLADGGQLSLLKPEVLLYAPTEDGSMEFLGVEYIIPDADWPHAEAPEFFGRELHYNPMLEIWALHVWSARENPEGLFEDFNPDVSCAFAPEE